MTTPPKPEETGTPARGPQTAVAPLNTIAPEDIAAASGRFDKWLRELTGGYVTLERLTMVAGSIPVLGNIMALIDVLMDIVGVTQKYLKKQAADFLDWVSLGINLIGVIPAPGTSTARMTLRPTLHLLRQELKHGVKNIGEALVTVLVAHLNDKLAGEIETFVDKAMGQLDGLLQDCAKLCDDLVDGLTNVLQRALGDKPLFDVDLPVTPEAKLHHSKTQSTWGRLLAGAVRLQKQTANYVAAKAAGAMPASAKLPVRAVIASLTDFKGTFRATLTRLADDKAEQSIRWLLRRLLEAVAKRKKTRSAMVPGNKGAQVTHQQPGEGLGAIGQQAPARNDPNGCKLCPAPGATKRSISYATGSESFTHTDFVLNAPLPIEWQRTYRSHATAFDQGPLGARWLTPFTARVAIEGQGPKRGLVFQAADGRSHRYPWLEVGQSHRDAVEDILLTRLSDSMLALDFGKPTGAHPDWREVYELTGREGQPQHFRLISQHGRDGVAIGLRYDHEVNGQPVLSDILSKQGDKTFAHVGVQPDAQGRIQGLYELKDGRVVRQLAAYTYDPHGDLVQAQDENAAAWHYQYRNHLVTRYTDRTGRGTNLQYDHYGDQTTAPKAVREWTDDGSFDTKLEWDENIRLTYITDALGGETWVYYDIDGYTYRVIHADQRQEWFFRDDAKNVTRHVHPDGSTDDYAYDEQGNLLQHVRQDGSVVHFEYDQANRLSGILDPEGGVWKRTYDPQGHLIEQTDPLGHTTAYTYDKAGRLIEVTDAKGGKKKLAYTPAGQLQRYTDCSNRSTTWEYDERGRTLSTTDAAGHTTSFRYTAVSAAALQAAHKAEGPGVETGNHPGQLEAVIHPDQTEERLRHDAEGRLLAHTDALGRTTAYRYNAAGLIEQRIDAAGHRLAYRWDRLGRLAELRNENNQPYGFQYDPVGRLLKETGFDGKTTEYRYAEETGVLAEVVDGPVTTQLSFDPMGRLTKRQATAPGQPEQTEVFGYLPGGQLGEARNEHAKLQYVYDAAGNLTREHHHYLQLKKTAVWRHRYNELGQRTGTTRPDGHTLEWLTYGSGHVHGLLLDGQEVVGFERDQLHREVHRLQANGLEQTHTYDPVGRLLEQQVLPHAGRQVDRERWSFEQLSAGAGSRLGQQAALVRRYRYDAAGQLEHISDSRRGALQYRYDPVGRLLKASSGANVEHFAFDPAGNIAAGDPENEHRLRPKPTPAVLDNLLKDYAGTHYRYDERGNLVERQHNGVKSEFEWDAFGRMAKAITPEGTTSFCYDPLGRRIAKFHERKAKGGNIASKTETVYGWDGDVLAFESSTQDQQASTIHYVHEAGSFVPLLQAVRQQAVELATTTDVQALKAANFGDYDYNLDPLWNGECDPKPKAFGKQELAFYQCDHLGTPQELTDHEGRVAWEASYKAWGEAKVAISEAASKAGFKNPIRFQGQYLDDETGLHYNRFRYYDPNVGRFLSRDPIGLLGGLNVHSYAPNTTEWTDPLGLSGNSAQRRAQRRAQARSAPKCCPCPETGHLYRGVSANHPAIADARRGIAAPALTSGGSSAKEHNEGGHSGNSQYTSWSRQKSIAQWHANKDGPGGVLLSAPLGAPKEGDCWSWEFSDDVYGEDEVLLKGRRSGLGVHKP